MRQAFISTLLSGGGSDKKVELLVQKVDLPIDEVHVGGGAAVPGHMCILLWSPGDRPNSENTWDVKHSFGSN